jgi:hypothetical protein
MEDHVFLMNQQDHFGVIVHPDTQVALVI